MNNKIKLLFIAVALGGFAVVSWLVMDTALHATGDYEFCTSCHSVAPMGAAYREDLHGGNNPQGWRAACTDCHLPHDNALHYLLVKGKHGVIDPMMELIKQPYDIDWHANRERREEFVYDSGCLECHKYLEDVSSRQPKVFIAHKTYFAADNTNSCVSCHKHVGHHQLGNHLTEMGWKKDE